MAKIFRNGAMVHRIDGYWATPREVRRGNPDSDGDIQVWDKRKNDWSFVKSDLLEEVPQPAPLCGAQEKASANHSCGSTKTQEGTANMAKVARSLVHVSLIDQDAGLDVSKSLVKDFGTMVMEGSQSELIQEILMDTKHNVESALRGHNAMRVKEVDLDILQRTGNSAKLREVKLKDLTWSVTAA
jgi:hypothetical protein